MICPKFDYAHDLKIDFIIIYMVMSIEPSSY